MNARKKKAKYKVWISPEEMHEDSKSWLSQLHFLKDEQTFLNILVKHYTPQLMQEENYAKSKRIIGELLDEEKELVALFSKVMSHEKHLGIMVDDVDQPEMEKAYTETHRKLRNEVTEYLHGYSSLKKRLFEMISEILKKEKDQRLLN